MSLKHTAILLTLLVVSLSVGIALFISRAITLFGGVPK